MTEICKIGVEKFWIIERNELYMRNTGKKINLSRITYIVVLVVVLLLNVIAWNSTDFCDWYIAYIFPVWVNTYGRLTGLFSFSVGEWLLVAGVFLVIAAFLLGAALLVTAVTIKITGKAFPMRLKRLGISFYRFFAWTVLSVALIMTLNCSILYHASTFSEHYFGEDNRDYTLEELITVYNMVAENCNYFSEALERDSQEQVLYKGSTGTLGNATFRKQLADMSAQARELMKQLGKEYSQLDGWYPSPKPMAFSDFMCQQYMQGYYFPFSMEANYNDVMHILNIPATMCHELAHLRGYIYEDEANFIAYLACIQSEDDFIEYAGYLSVLNYLYNDLMKAWQVNPEAFEAAAKNVPPVAVSEQVWEDNIFVSDEEWERINKKAWINTETVDEVSDVFVDTSLKLNGVSDGKASYSRVVKLLLQYYYRK